MVKYTVQAPVGTARAAAGMVHAPPCTLGCAHPAGLRFSRLGVLKLEPHAKEEQRGAANIITSCPPSTQSAHQMLRRPAHPLVPGLEGAQPGRVLAQAQAAR